MYSPANEKLDQQVSTRPEVRAEVSHRQRVGAGFEGDTEAWSVPMDQCATAAHLQGTPH